VYRNFRALSLDNLPATISLVSDFTKICLRPIFRWTRTDLNPSLTPSQFWGSLGFEYRVRFKNLFKKLVRELRVRPPRFREFSGYEEDLIKKRNQETYQQLLGALARKETLALAWWPENSVDGCKIWERFISKARQAQEYCTSQIKTTTPRARKKALNILLSLAKRLTNNNQDAVKTLDQIIEMQLTPTAQDIKFPDFLDIFPWNHVILLYRSYGEREKKRLVINFFDSNMVIFDNAAEYNTAYAHMYQINTNYEKGLLPFFDRKMDVARDIIKSEDVKLYYYRESASFVMDRPYLQRAYPVDYKELPGMNGSITLIPF